LSVLKQLGIVLSSTVFSGALAERNTFQGERCIYNALNDKIRNLLLKYDYSKSTDPLQPWSSHLTSLLSRDRPKTSDISLISGSESFQLHKFLLSARTPFFRQRLSEAPETTTWRLSDTIPVDSFRVVLKYLYLGDLPRDLVDPASETSEEDVFKGIDKISKQLEVQHLWESVLSVNDRRLTRQRYQDEVERANGQVNSFFQDNVLKHKMVVDTRKVDEIKWPRDNSIFADCLIRADEEEQEHLEAVQPGHINGIPIGPPSGTDAQDGAAKQRRSVVYPVHKALLIRSPYFETMFSGEFLEAQESEHLRIIKIDCIPDVLEIILTFLYTENVDCSLDLALDLLYAADMLFLDKLKAKAAVTISTLGSGNNNVLVDRTHAAAGDGAHREVEVEPINVYDVIRAAWDLGVQRLEEFAARYFANRLEDYIDEDEFAALIQESASRLKTREETDTIELLDDIRYYLSERFRLRFEDAGIEELLDDEGEIDAALVEQLSETVIEEWSKPTVGQMNGVMRTLDGELVEDEFESDAQNYQILLSKIEVLLDRLRLDA